MASGGGGGGKSLATPLDGARGMSNGALKGKVMRNKRWLLAIAAAAPAAVAGARALHRYLRLRRRLRHIRSAPDWSPIIGQTPKLAMSVNKFPCTWDLLCQWPAETAPEPVRVQIFMRQCVATADPASLRTAFQTEREKYAKDVEFAYEPFLDILGTGLVTAEGKLWWQQRKRVQHAFRVEILDHIVRVAGRAADRLASKLASYEGKGLPVDMNEEFRHLTLQVIGEGILSLTPEEADRVFPLLYLPVMEEFNRRSLEPWRPYLPLPGTIKAKVKVRKLDRYVLGIIRDRRQQHRAHGCPSDPDILDRVLSAVSEEEFGPEMEKQLCYEVKTFVLAGHETSAAMLTWTLYELSRHPRELQWVQEEGQGKFRIGEPTSKEDVEPLHVTLAALKESLRLYSVVPVVTRKLVEDSRLGGKDIPAGTTVICSLQAVHHRADLWPKPMEYKLSRFLGEEAENRDPFHFLPFIQGPRNCLGQHLALLEARAVLQKLVQRFSFSPLPGYGARNPNMIPIAPHGGMPMLVSSRQQ